MGISHADFWQMTLQEILNAHKGYLEKTYNDWRRTRCLWAAIYNAPRGKNDKMVKPTDLMKLPGDVATTDFSDEISKIEEYREAVKKS